MCAVYVERAKICRERETCQTEVRCCIIFLGVDHPAEELVPQRGYCWKLGSDLATNLDADWSFLDRNTLFCLANMMKVECGSLFKPTSQRSAVKDFIFSKGLF